MQKKSLIFFLLKLLKIPLTIITLSITAKYFGVSIEKDIWLIGLAGIIMIDTAIWGPINETFRAKFIMLKEDEGEYKAINNAKSLIFYIFLFSVILLIFLESFPKIPAQIFAPGFNLVEQKKLQNMIQFLAPFLLINQFNLISTAILNAYDVFYIPEISSLITQLINIVLIYFLGNIIGVYSLAIALYISSFILLISLIIILNKKCPNIFPKKIPGFIGFKFFFIFAMPFFIPYFIGQINGFIERALATKIGFGAISILDFSKKIPDMLSFIMTTIILTMLVPTLTKSFIKHDKINFEKDFQKTYQLGLLGIIFFCSIFITEVGENIIKILYESNEISITKMNTIIFLSKIFSIAIIAVYSYIIFGMCLLSINKSKIYALWGTIAQVIVIAMNILLVDYLGIIIFPISFFLAHYISALFMFRYYPYDKTKIALITIKYYFFGIITITLSYYCIKFLHYSYTENITMKLIYISSSVSLTIIIFYILGIFFNLNEIKSFNTIINKLYKKYLI